MNIPSVEWWVPVLWIAAVLLASVVYRRVNGKPVLFFDVPNATFLQRAASGFSTDSWWKRLGHASNCLVVAIVDSRLVIRPFTPFNLLFLPELYGLEHEVPLTRVVSVRRVRKFFSSRLVVAFRDSEGGTHEVVLALAQPDEFIRHFPSHVAVA